VNRRRVGHPALRFGFAFHAIDGIDGEFKFCEIDFGQILGKRFANRAQHGFRGRVLVALGDLAA